MEFSIILVTILSILSAFSAAALLVALYNRKPLRRTARITKVHTLGLCLAGLVILGFPLFCILMPLTGVVNAWVYEVVLIEIAIIAYYILSLYYRTLQLSNLLQKIVAYIVIMSAVAMIYMVVFYLVYKWLFKIHNAPSEVFVLNFVMIIIVLILLPLIWELFGFVRSLVSSSTVDLTYVVKKLSKFATSNVKANEVADFLADYMHFQYIGIFLEGKLYSSKNIDLSEEELLKISRLRAAEKFWQEVPVEIKAHGIFAITELKNARGAAYGQILICAPVGKKMPEHKDLVQMEMVVNLVTAVLDSEQRVGYKRKGWRKE